MIPFPKHAKVGRIIAKENFYDKTDYATKLLFQNEIARITWEYKLAPSTINVAAHTWPEIEVFRIELKNYEMPDKVLKVIDLSIPYPILFIVTKGNSEKAIISYKEQSQKKNTAKVDTYFATSWNDSALEKIAIDGLDTDTIYDNFIRQIAGDRLVSQTKTAAVTETTGHVELANTTANTESAESAIIIETSEMAGDIGATTVAEDFAQAKIPKPASLTSENFAQDKTSKTASLVSEKSKQDRISKPASLKDDLERMKEREKIQKQIDLLDRRIKSEPSIGKKQMLAEEKYRLMQQL